MGTWPEDEMVDGPSFREVLEVHWALVKAVLGL